MGEAEASTMRSQLSNASIQAAALYQSLQLGQQYNEQIVRSRKEAVSQLLQNLTNKITLFESVIPLPQVESSPIAFDSCTSS